MHIYNNTKNFPYLMKNIHPDWRSSANHNPNKQTKKMTLKLIIAKFLEINDKNKCSHRLKDLQMLGIIT